MCIRRQELIPPRRKARQKVSWESEDILLKQAYLKMAMHKRDIDPTRENRYHFQVAQIELKETTEQETYIKFKITLIERFAINKQAALAWKTVNEVSSRKSCNKAKPPTRKNELENGKPTFEISLVRLRGFK